MRVAIVAGGFGLFMAIWNGLLIHIDATQRTARNVILEHLTVEFLAVMSVAWLLVGLLEYLRLTDLAWYTLGAIPYIGFVWLVTRGQIKGEQPRELFD